MPDPVPMRPADPKDSQTSSVAPRAAPTTDQIRYQRLSQLGQVIKRKRKDGPGLALVLGAGVSLSAGVPLASGWVPLLWRFCAGEPVGKAHVSKILSVQKTTGYSFASYDADFAPFADQTAKSTPTYQGAWLEHHPRHATDEYTAIMASLSPIEQQNAVCSILDSCSLTISWPYIRIAQLIKDGFIDTVLTTNLDTVLLETLALFGIFPAICDFHAAAVLRSPDANRPQVIYLHGNRNSYNVRNTNSAVKSYEDPMRRFLRNLLDERTLLVSGYAGWDDGLMSVLRDHFAPAANSTRRHDIYWGCFRETPNPPPLPVEHGVRYIEHAPAEILFDELANILSAGPVPLVADPLKYILDILDRIDREAPQAKAANLDKQIAAIRAAAKKAEPVSATAILEAAAGGNTATAKSLISQWFGGVPNA